MSSTNKTATIELSQYVGTDKPTYLVDYNGDMLKIDNAIAADRDSISTAQNTADGAVTKADTNKDSIDAVNAQLNGDPEVPGDTGLAGDVNAVEGIVNTMTSLIGSGSPTTSEQTIIGAINSIEGAIAPREDGLLLANSYAQGEQFARGGSVYEALTSLTAGTAFASLVLNTDYKVADTLVEQIANASPVLPDMYGLKTKSKVEILADGVKTWKDLAHEAALALLTVIQGMESDEFLRTTAATIPNINGRGVPTNAMDYTSTTNSYFGAFSVLKLSADALSAGSIIPSTSATSGVYLAAQTTTSGISHTDISAEVPTGGSVAIFYDIYKKL